MPYLNELDGSGSAPGMPAAGQDQAAGLWPAGASLEEKRKNAHDKLVHDIFRKPENREAFVTAVDTLLAGRVAELRSEGLTETLLRQMAKKWGKPSKRIADTIKAGTDREVRAWTAAILEEREQADFLAAPDNPKYADG